MEKKSNRPPKLLTLIFCNASNFTKKSKCVFSLTGTSEDCTILKLAFKLEEFSPKILILDIIPSLRGKIPKILNFFEKTEVFSKGIKNFVTLTSNVRSTKLKLKLDANRA